MIENFMDKLIDGPTPIINVIALIIAGTVAMTGVIYALMIIGELAPWILGLLIGLLIFWSFRRTWKLFRS
jgi:hypothetical protein